MKRGISVTLAFFAIMAMIGCSETKTTDSPTSPKPQAASDSRNLTQSKAQNALNRWVSGKGGSVTIQGIKELPQENSAKVDLRLTNLRWTVRAEFAGVTFNRECGSCQGIATFSHYNDGRWVLMNVETLQGAESGSWTGINIEAQ